MRLLPWLHEAARRDDHFRFTDCESCQMTTTQESRQMLGCGYTPPPSALPVVPWEHPGRRPPSSERDDAGVVATPVCPGYLCKLPEVIEVARARIHWERGHLVQFCGSQPTEEMLGLIEVLEGAANEMQHWAMTPASKGGGGQG